jgi:phosphatase NudJ
MKQTLKITLHYDLPQVSGNAGCMVKRNGLILMVKSFKSPKWEIPAGKPQENELAHETALRETFEETGLSVIPVKLLEVFDDSFYMYEAKLLNQNIKKLTIPETAKDEIVEIDFLNIDELNYNNVRYPCSLDRKKELFRGMSES